MALSNVSERAKQVLKILIERYIQNGSPVGSSTIAKESHLGLSSATIRHILVELEENGLLASLHTSSGRIPTALGYRFFVDSLLTIKPLAAETINELKHQLNPDLELPLLLQSASSLLSGLTQMIGIVALPQRNRVCLRQVEFLPLGQNRVLVILVLNNREVQNRIIYTEKIYSASELQQAANYLTEHFEGKDLLEARGSLLAGLQTDQEQMTSLLQAAVEVANKAFIPDQNAGKDYMLAGQNHLWNFAKQEDFAHFNQLFAAFAEKQTILNLLNQSIEAEGVQIFIGNEAGYTAFTHYSMVTSTYAVGDQLLGSLGVIGPTRMPYDKVITAVDVTAKLLSAALNHD